MTGLSAGETREPNSFRKALDVGSCPIQTYLSCSSLLLAEAIGAVGYDSVVVDLQHGEGDYGDAFALLSVLSHAGTTPMVRVPWNDPTIIMRVLDAGALGVVCPMINSREQAEAFVGACRYPPLGYRSFGPLRTGGAGSPPSTEFANVNVLTIAQVETVQAIENIVEIVTTPGLDALFPGPSDLSVSAGGITGAVDYDDPAALERLRIIIKAAHEAGVYVGLPAVSARWIPVLRDLGIDWLQVGVDWLTAGVAFSELLRETRAEVSAHAQGPASDRNRAI